MTQDFQQFAGSEHLKQLLSDRVRKHTLSHAYILEGPAGCGKRRLALLLAAATACRHTEGPIPCLACDACRRILDGNAPDIKHLRPQEGKQSIGVEEVRMFRQDMYLSATEFDLKIYIIEQAHLLTAEAQNALLTVLEEPPEQILMLLLTEDAASLLPTIRSRAAVLRLERLPIPLLRETALCLSDQARAAEQRDPEAFSVLLTEADGCLGRLLESLDGDRTDAEAARTCTDRLLHALSGKPDAAALDSAMSALPDQRAACMKMLLVFQSALRDLIVLARYPGASLRFFTDSGQAQHFAHCPVTRLVRYYDCTETALQALDANANPTLTVAILARDLCS